jgi:hypothetical protein
MNDQEGYQSICLDFVHNRRFFYVHLKSHSRALNFKKRLLRLGTKKDRVFFDVECSTKNSEVLYFVTLCYSPYDYTPTAATVAISTGGVSLLICKKFYLLPYSPLRYTVVSK